MKKLTSVILSVLMVVSLFSCVFTGTTVSAEQTATNLITNGDFESFNVNTEGNKVPAFAWRNVKTILGTDKTNGQWYRTTSGSSPADSPDLGSNYSILTAEQLLTTYPTYFGPNNQMVIEPTESGDSTNRVLRAVQDLNTQIEVKNNGEYSLSFRFKLPQSDTGLTSFGLFLITPNQNQNSDSLSQTLNSFKEPYNITNATLDPSGTDSGITINSNNKITFSGTSTEWQNVKVIFNVKRNDEVAIPVYTEDEVNYTFPVLMRIHFDTESAETSKGYAEHITDSSIKNKDSYRKKCIYFDDFAMYELVNCIGDAEFYDVKGNKLDNEQAYTKVTTTVNNTETSTIYSGDEVTATVAEYDKTSGAYTFLGWYKGDEKVTKGLSDDGMSVTFTAAVDETYTPRFGSANLLGSSGSFEGLTTGMHLRMDAPTDDTPNYPTGNKWGFNVNAGYWGKTWKQSVIGKDGTSYAQVSSGSIRKDLITNGNCNILENTAIAKSGSKFLHLNHIAPVSLGLDNLEKGTDYALSFYLRYSSANTNKIYAGAITTTVNISNATLSGDMKTSLENAIGATNHPIVVAKCDATALSNATSDGWSKITFNFNSGNFEKLYLAFRTASGAPTLDYYIDDMVLVKAGNANSVSADVEFQNANGDAVDSSNEYAKADIIGNFDGTYTTAVDYDRDSGAYAFKGWYYKGDFITADETFVIDTAAYNDFSLFKAVIISSNLLPEAASFESYKSQTTLTYADNEKGDGVYPPPTSTKWGTSYEGTYFKDNYFKIHTVYGQYEVPCYNKDTKSYVKKSFNAHSGNSMLRINTHSRSAIRALENLTPNTDYQLTFYVMGTSSVDYLSAVGVAVRYDDYYLNIANADTEGSVAVKKLEYAEGWQKVELSFNSGSHKTLYLHMCQTAKATNYAEGGSFVDDLSLIAMPKVDGISYKGASIRAYATEDKPQALRHKFEIKKSLINDNIALYGELVEYGSVAIRTDYLGGKELVKDGVYTYNDTTKKAVTGVAYNKDDGTNKIFIENEDSIVFTAALTGIGKTGSGTNYAAFGNEYSVRNYLIFRNGTKETIVYTETQSYSIFDVMKYIIDTYEADTSTQNDTLRNDYNTIQSILNSDTDQKTAYEAWLANQ